MTGPERAAPTSLLIATPLLQGRKRVPSHSPALVPARCPMGTGPPGGAHGSRCPLLPPRTALPAQALARGAVRTGTALAASPSAASRPTPGAGGLRAHRDGVPLPGAVRGMGSRPSRAAARGSRTLFAINPRLKPLHPSCFELHMLPGETPPWAGGDTACSPPRALPAGVPACLLAFPTRWHGWHVPSGSAGFGWHGVRWSRLGMVLVWGWHGPGVVLVWGWCRTARGRHRMAWAWQGSGHPKLSLPALPPNPITPVLSPCQNGTLGPPYCQLSLQREWGRGSNPSPGALGSAPCGQEPGWEGVPGMGPSPPAGTQPFWKPLKLPGRGRRESPKGPDPPLPAQPHPALTLRPCPSGALRSPLAAGREKR